MHMFALYLLTAVLIADPTERNWKLWTVRFF